MIPNLELDFFKIRRTKTIKKNLFIEKVEDYNIFNRDGQSLGSLLTLKKNHCLPLATYKNLQSDPLGEIVNALAKLREGGEGGALQVIFSPAPGGWTGQAKKILEEDPSLKKYPALREKLKSFHQKIHLE